jgi:hypothetical protein
MAWDGGEDRRQVSEDGGRLPKSPLLPGWRWTTGCEAMSGCSRTICYRIYFHTTQQTVSSICQPFF